MGTETTEVKTTKIVFDESELTDMVRSELQSRGLINNKNGTDIYYEISREGSILEVVAIESILMNV